MACVAQLWVWPIVNNIPMRNTLMLFCGVNHISEVCTNTTHNHIPFQTTLLSDNCLECISPFNLMLHLRPVALCSLLAPDYLRGISANVQFRVCSHKLSQRGGETDEIRYPVSLSQSWTRVLLTHSFVLVLWLTCRSLVYSAMCSKFLQVSFTIFLIY